MDFICQSMLDVMAYKNGYGDKYSVSVINEIDELRVQICDKLQTTTGVEKINLEKLLCILDNDSDINRKRGL